MSSAERIAWGLLSFIALIVLSLAAHVAVAPPDLEFFEGRLSPSRVPERAHELFAQRGDISCQVLRLLSGKG
jgi:hypothetical protein